MTQVAVERDTGFLEKFGQRYREPGIQLFRFFPFQRPRHSSAGDPETGFCSSIGQWWDASKTKAITAAPYAAGQHDNHPPRVRRKFRRCKIPAYVCAYMERPFPHGWYKHDLHARATGAAVAWRPKPPTVAAYDDGLKNAVSSLERTLLCTEPHVPRSARAPKTRKTGPTEPLWGSIYP